MSLTRRSDIYTRRQKFGVVNRIHDRQFAIAVQDFRQQARTILAGMKDNENRSREIPREGRENGLEYLQTSCRAADNYDISVRHESPVRLDAENAMQANESRHQIWPDGLRGQQDCLKIRKPEVVRSGLQVR